MRSVTVMESEFEKRAADSVLRKRRYAIRYPFAVDAEMLDLESGTRLRGVTSDLSLGGCFVCTRRPWQIGVRVRLALTRKDQKVEALAVVRVVVPRTGMGLEFLEVEPTSNKTLWVWIESLRKSQ